MNFLDAAYEILKQAGKPLHYAEITRRALDAHMLDTKGQTPEATMGSRLYVDTKKPRSRFKRVNGNLFTLVGNQSSAISEQIAEINRQTRSKLHQRLLTMPPDRFETLIGELLLALGFKEDTIEVTRYGGDSGIDVRGVLVAGDITEVNAAVQVKRWKSNIQAPVVQALRGSLVVHEQGIIITTSKFSKGAVQEAQAPGKTRISLVDGDALIELLVDRRIGVTSEQYDVYSLDEEWWGDIVLEELPSPTIIEPPTVVAHAGFPIHIEAKAQKREYIAELLDPTGRVRYEGKEYKSPSRAGMMATGWKSCNGWTFWRYLNSATGQWHIIDEIRRKESISPETSA